MQVADPDLLELLEQAKLTDFGSNALGLFALLLRFEAEDVTLVASRAITDGPDDKKCDLIFIDDEAESAVIAQSYWSGDQTKTTAPANKASDLNTAAGWLLNRDLADIPQIIRAQAHDLREALESGKLQFLEFWYVHNLPETSTVQSELATVSETAVNALRQRYPDSRCQVVVREVGRSTIRSWWRATQADVAIEGEFIVPIEGAYKESSDEWSAVAASVAAKWLYDLWQEHKTELFRGNVRDYLGIINSDANINNAIRKTAREKPTRFWAYNNGLTAIVRRLDYDDAQQLLKIDGLSIVNGAQTTGVLGNLGSAPADKAKVQVRFIAAKDAELVREIIQANNSQNSIEAADFRSTDSVQTRLRDEFRQIYPDIKYLGGRRGGEENAIRRDNRVIDSNEVAKSLTAFHQNPTAAYNRVKELWGDSIYPLIFPDSITAGHIAFVYSLYRAIAKYKAQLQSIAEGSRTSAQKQRLELLKYSSASFAFIAGIGAAVESIIDRAIPNSFSTRFSTALTIEAMVDLWLPVVELLMPYLSGFQAVIFEGLKNEDRVKHAITSFATNVEAFVQTAGERLVPFRGSVIVS